MQDLYQLLDSDANATFPPVTSTDREPADAFALREEELTAPADTGPATRREVSAVAGNDLSPLLRAFRSSPSRVTWIASLMASPPLLCLLQTLDQHTNLHLDIVAPFGEDCYPDPLSMALATALETWSDDWQLHILEGPTYPGHVFILDGRVLLCRDPLLTPTPDSPDWVDADLGALPSLMRRLRRRRAACRLLPPGSLNHPPSGSVSLPDLPLPATPEERERRSILLRFLSDRAS